MTTTKKTPTWSPAVGDYEDRLEELESAIIAVDSASEAADEAALATGKTGRELALLVDGDEDLFSKHYMRMRRAVARRNGTEVPKRPRGNPKREPRPDQPSE